MLKRAKDLLPQESGESIRLEIPKALGHIQGNRTIINNFCNIANVLRRKPEHILKFLQKELATPGEIIKGAVLLGSKIPASRFNSAMQKYADVFVFCRECGKPDTELIIEYGFATLKCQACGAKYSVS